MKNKSAEEILEKNTGHAHGLMDAMVFKSMKEYAEQFKPKWISVENSLPENHNLVLVFLVSGAITTGRLDNENSWKAFTYSFGYAECWVSHWQPLPESPL